MRSEVRVQVPVNVTNKFEIGKWRECLKTLEVHKYVWDKKEGERRKIHLQSHYSTLKMKFTNFRDENNLF